uniref:Immunoglobulin subtype domain-containing protein n=1 Tax=Sinocyclocheilus rhinocerous TaxID=307959 RepID=A0A673MRC8_9TELE
LGVVIAPGSCSLLLTLGDSVTLHTDVTEIREDDDILWKFGAGKSQIAKIKKKKDRLKLDNQTGSLTITNITTQHTGVYQLEIAGAKKASKTFSVSVYESRLIVVFIFLFILSCFQLVCLFQSSSVTLQTVLHHQIVHWCVQW